MSSLLSLLKKFKWAWLLLLLLVLVGVIVGFRNDRTSYEPAYSSSVTATGVVKEVELVAQESSLELLGSKEFKLWSYNGQVPGPEIHLNKGDKLRIKFKNLLPQATTIHFHGVRVPNAMDGVPGVTQEPVQPGESFVYEFIPKDAGTFWYHPHVRGSEQVERGLYGVLVVEDPQEPKYDLDKVVVLDDWRLAKDGQLDPRFNTRMDLMHDGRWGQLLTVNGQTDYSLVVKPGQRLRLRFVNTSNARVYKLDFAGLVAKGFAVDGMLAREVFNAQAFELAPGNRLDVELFIPEISDQDSFVISDNFTRRRNSLISLKVEPTSIQPQKFITPVAQNFPDWSFSDKIKIDKQYFLNARRGGQFGVEWTINGKAYPDYDPVSLKKDQFNVISFTNQSSRLHPMHLHGQFFKVLARNGTKVDEPYLRDTVLLKAKETVVLGLFPLDPGRWVSHCHILEHAEAGMLTVVEVK